MFSNWWTNRLKTDFTPKGILVRVAVDLFLSNIGLFLGILTTVGIYVFSANVTPQAFFREMFVKVWLANVLPLTFCCLFAYAVNGLYRGTRNMPYLSRIPVVSKAVGTAFCLFLLWIFIMKPFIPRMRSRYY
jgi:hypothetical protein